MLGSQTFEGSRLDSRKRERWLPARAAQGSSAGAREGAGKRGGLRVIYFVRYQPNEFWMLTLYAKAKQENAPAHILKRLKEAFEHD